MAESNLTSNSKPAPLTGYQPSDDQLARVNALRRFNRLTIYLPLGVLSVLLAAMVIYLLYLAIFPPTDETRLFLSGLADFILVLWMIPLVLIFGILLAAGVGGYLYYRYGMDETERPLSPAPPYGRVRTLLWRVDHLMVRLRPKLLDMEDRIARPIIRFNAWLAYVTTWLQSLRKHYLRR